MPTPRRLILKQFQSPGDITVMSATVRDLHLAHAGQFETDVRTSADALWLNNPYITRLNEGQPGVECIDMHYPLVHESHRPYHFLHGFAQYLEQRGQSFLDQHPIEHQLYRRTFLKVGSPGTELEFAL